MSGRRALRTTPATQRQVSTEILQTDSPELFEIAVRRSVELLQAGEVVALPTETVYGLAANALDAKAVTEIFEIKGRPSNNPIIAHIVAVDMARRCASHWPSLADRLANSFWPGPLTLVLPRAPEIPDVVTAGGCTVGIRWPSHPFIQAVIRRCGFPLAAPSANLSNRVSPTNAQHVLKELGGKIRLIIDGGQSQVGIESTVLDLSCSPPRLLRPGMIHRQAILTAAGNLADDSGEDSGIPKSPGMPVKHYCPRAKLVLYAWSDERQLRDRAELLHVPRSKIHIIAHTHIPSVQDFGGVSVIPHDAEAFARAIYAQLHQCDEAGAAAIIVETVPETDEWSGVLDRLNRAAS